MGNQEHGLAVSLVGQLQKFNRFLGIAPVQISCRFIGQQDGRLVNEAEEFIASVSDIEIRSILSFHYIEGMGWAQVAYNMNVLYGDKIYTPDGCRVKHERFLKKF